MFFRSTNWSKSNLRFFIIENEFLLVFLEKTKKEQKSSREAYIINRVFPYFKYKIKPCKNQDLKKTKKERKPSKEAYIINTFFIPFLFFTNHI